MKSAVTVVTKIGVVIVRACFIFLKFKIAAEILIDAAIASNTGGMVITRLKNCKYIKVSGVVKTVCTTVRVATLLGDTCVYMGAFNSASGVNRALQRTKKSATI